MEFENKYFKVKPVDSNNESVLLDVSFTIGKRTHTLNEYRLFYDMSSQSLTAISKNASNLTKWFLNSVAPAYSNKDPQNDIPPQYNELLLHLNASQKMLIQSNKGE